MATFVLIHGAWTGGWFWWRVANVLRDAGHRVVRPTLTGLGERAHLATKDVDLNLHIADVVNSLRYEDVNRVVLAGHGYGGTVLTGAADREPARIHHLVYVDAFTPENGQSTLGVAGPQLAARMQTAAKEKGEGWLVPMPFDLSEFGITAEVDTRWITHRLTPMPLKALEQQLKLTGGIPARLPRTCIHATRSNVPPFGEVAARARASGWRYKEVDTGYFSPVTDPKAVAQLLIECAP